MLKRPHYIAVGLVVLLALIVLNLPGRATARLKLAIGSLFLPHRGGVGIGFPLAGDPLLPCLGLFGFSLRCAEFFRVHFLQFNVLPAFAFDLLVGSIKHFFVEIDADNFAM